MIALTAAIVLGAGFTEPPAGSALRKQLIDTLRPAVEHRLGRGIEFRVTVVRVERDWAFVVADPQWRGGEPIDGYKLFGQDFSNMDGLRVDAVLHKHKGRWQVVDHAIGATDVWYCSVGPRSLKAGWGC